MLATPTLAAITVGATVKDTSGGVVGTVTKLTGDNVVVDTGTHKVTIPTQSFVDTPQGPLLALTKSQLDAAAVQAAAAQEARLANAIQPGATLRGSQGAVLGSIAALDGEFVMVQGEAGQARIPKADLYLAADGLHFGMTAAQFAEAVKASNGAGSGTD
ncbi:MAG: hypothetical protein B7Y35_13515 [Sphingomonadales bacterium 28-64-96]|nr:MAG: hypothetical protein B7Y35_13515 [Sphingomonadales bacterium 28-64-96]